MNAREAISMYRQPVEMPGGYMFNQAETLKRIDLYYNSKFESGQYDTRGFRKFFYNIIKPACDIASKFVDLDTKDIILIPEKSDDELRVWLMQKDLKLWLKKEKFGRLLNEIGHHYPKYGSVVLKKNKEGWKNVPLQNLRLDPSADSLSLSPFVYEVFLLSRNEIKKMGWNKEAVKELLSRGDDEKLFVYACYEQNEDGWDFSIKGDLFAKRDPQGRVVRSAETIVNEDSNQEYLPELVLFEGKVKELPYRELHWEKVPGRWLGYGFAEYLFDNQIRENELANIKAKGLYYTSLKVYQTRDDTIGKNILTDVENGDILRVTSEVTPVMNEERNLAVFSQEEARWGMNTERKTFSTDIVRGGDLPSHTPLGVAKLSAGMALSYFELKRENFGLFIKDLMLDDVLPSFKKISKKEHILTVLSSDGDIERLDKLISESVVGKAILEMALSQGMIPSLELAEMKKQEVLANLKNQRARFLDIPSDFYDNVEYSMDVLITGEQMDTGVQISTLQVAMQLLGSNPMLIQNKATRTIFFKLLELSGVSPAELNIMDEQMDVNPQMMMPQGGSIASPNASMPVPSQIPSAMQL